MLLQEAMSGIINDVSIDPSFSGSRGPPSPATPPIPATSQLRSLSHQQQPQQSSPQLGSPVVTSQADDGAEVFRLGRDDYEALMLAMQQELLADEACLAAEQAAEEEDVASMLDALTIAHPDIDGHGVLCPICKSAYLYEGMHYTDGGGSHRSVQCRGDHELVLDIGRQGGVGSLVGLQGSMAVVLESHSMSACAGAANFETMPSVTSGMSDLVVACSLCGLSKVVS